ncbi:uncharacterized protein FA14DRAFT_177834 [Meira miltonrushii]|uniref:Ricin B lectin domain-containing protein n=1 Tax=Meira miltonrushii TaxID=1280837 RepID=A0A316VLV1_9BASI|nr:uncharacterized protein FA14DRAFT_177834 [Meira miltonrushii]PWN38572.1 hypothetical protein FA14DRAFT_177834 [Meira miltonrushii]
MQVSTIVILTIGVAATWASAIPMNLARRDSVSCKAKYRGNLYSTYLSSLSDTSDISQRGFAIDKDDQNYLVDTWNYQGQFQFDECTTSGWNQSPKEFGQLKYVNLGDYKAVTAKPVASDKGHALHIQNAASSNNGLLERQWWYADWLNDKSGGEYVTLQLSGNPNDANQDYNLPNADIDYDGHVTATSSYTGFTYTLFDITYP